MIQTFLPVSSTSESVLLIVLLADTPINSVLQVEGNYHDIFTTLFRSSIDSISRGQDENRGDRKGLTIESYDVVQGKYPSDARLHEAAGVLITGSAASAYLALPWILRLTEYVRRLPEMKPTLKIIGICFGHQVLANSFGAVVVKNELGWEIGVRKVDMNDWGQRIFGTTTLDIHQMHQDHVPSLPPTFHSIGSTLVCPIQGLVRLVSSDESAEVTAASIQIISLQGHPEFTSSIVNKVIEVRECGGVISEELATASREHADQSSQGIKIGRLFLEMLGAV